ncbi:tryptophan halogenase family protein [Agaribacter flavus]|uniref:Tryptophan halogenase family protein n=1 Tax=Agaribacter flavus TaxID=1902781 RepID=A0ABV7FQ44_9ALTE
MQVENEKTRKVLIVGGGTAGWMTANLFAKQLSDKGFSISLIESDNVPTVGVGEGTTPYIKRLFESLNISEQEWMPECDATYKSGITFAEWSTTPGFTQYFHPFYSQHDSEAIEAFKQITRLRHHGYDVPVHPNDYFLQATLVKQGKLPFLQHDESGQNVYAYHFDAAKLGLYLAKVARSLGVKHIVDHVIRVNTAASGDILSVETEHSGEIQADLFVDCTGFSAMLIGKTLGVPFHSFKDNLLNDAAVAIPTKIDNTYSPQTISTAMSNGWRWEIPLTKRKGNGYVYSSQFQSKSSAESELRHILGDTILEDAQAHHVDMRVGRMDKHWHKNCVAIGLSQGFIEPLEATALQIVQISIEEFLTQYQRGNYTTQYQEYFNNGVNNVFEHIRDYIVLHYLTNSRAGSTYWATCRNEIKLSDSLQAIMEVWCQGEDLDAELKRQNITMYYSEPSWYVLLAGMGIFPSRNQNQMQTHEEANSFARKIRGRVLDIASHY